MVTGVMFYSHETIKSCWLLCTKNSVQKQTDNKMSFHLSQTFCFTKQRFHFTVCFLIPAANDRLKTPPKRRCKGVGVAISAHCPLSGAPECSCFRACVGKDVYMGNGYGKLGKIDSAFRTMRPFCAPPPPPAHNTSLDESQRLWNVNFGS